MIEAMTNAATEVQGSETALFRAKGAQLQTMRDADMSKIRIPAVGGERYGRLSIIREIEPGTRAGNRVERYVECRCDCGNVISIRFRILRHQTRSCGCLVKDTRVSTHGKSGSKLYRIWMSMRDRCLNENSRAYPRYGLRGISVCPEWSDFLAFESWALKNGYKSDLEIDRKNNDGSYTPDNCRWIPGIDNRRNTSRCKWWFINGVRYAAVKLAAEAHGVSIGTIVYWCKTGKHDSYSVLKYPQ